MMVPSSPILLTILRENRMKATNQVQLRLSEVRDVFVLSASDNLIAALVPIAFSVLSEHKMKQVLQLSRELPLRSSISRDVLDLSASANLITESVQSLLPVSSERNEAANGYRKY
jgi:hypothetical protein